MSLTCGFAFPYLRGRDSEPGVFIESNCLQALCNISSYTDEALLTLAYQSPDQKWVSCVLFDRILNNSQIFNEKVFCEVFDMVLATNPELKDSIISNVSCYFIRFLNKIDLEHPDFTRIFYILAHLTGQNIDLKHVKSLLKIKQCSKLLKICINIRNHHDFESAKSLLLMSSKLKQIKLFLERETNLLISTILDTLIDIYDFNNLNGLNRSLENCASKVIESLSFIKTFDPISPLNLSKIVQIESCLNYNVPKFIQISENESQSPLAELLPILWRPKAIYNRSLNDFKVRVFLGSFPSGELVCKKIYKFSSPGKYEKSIENEIQTLETLSQRSSPSNCFLKFYGSKHSAGLIEIFMEAHEKTLRNFIEDRGGQSIPREKANNFISKLLEFFAELQTLGIFHRDIKPSNILITQQETLKVIDFGTASKIDQSDVTVQHDVQGTQNYMAPELLEVDGTCLKTGKYRPEKSDVYSLGVTFFEMIHAGLVTGLPGGKEEFRKEFRRFVNILDADITVKSLLVRMLEPSYTLRPDFKECLNILHDDETNLN